MKLLYKLLLIPIFTVLFLSGCGKNSRDHILINPSRILIKLIAVPEYEDSSIKLITNKLAKTTGIPNIQLAANATIPFKVYAINIKTNEIKDVTDIAELKGNSYGFSVQDNTITTNDGINADTSKNTGVVTISISDKNSVFHPFKNSLNITLVDIPICGNGLGRGNGMNDTDKNNGKGPCIKVVNTADALYTGSPSCKLLNSLNKTTDKCDDNGYARLTMAPAKNICEMLNTKNFTQRKKNNWGFPNTYDLVDFINKINKQTDNVYNLAINGNIFSDGDELTVYGLNGQSNNRHLDEANYVICKSSKQ